MTDPLTSKVRILVATAAVAAMGLGGASLLDWTTPSIAGPVISQQPQVNGEEVQPAIDLSNAFVAIADAVTPAVVRIEVERTRTVQRPGQQGMPPLYEWFFGPPGEQDGGPQQPQQPQQRQQITGGSGFIISEDGYIVTNDHVVSGADAIQVYMPDGREFAAELVGADPTTDVAVIRIDEQDLPTLSFGASSDMRVGEWVLAVGNPGVGGRALEYTVTSGIISAIGRPLTLIQNELQRQEGYAEIAPYAIEDFIQTDAAINPGNSGGPLVNTRGQVIGINTAIASRTGTYVGYGFAVPMDLAARIVEDLVQYGEVRRPLLGVQMDPITNVDAEYYGLPGPNGVLVQNASEDGPAYQAGIRQEDVIVAVDGEPIERPGQLQLRIAQYQPGDEVTVRFYREGEPREVEIRLGEADLGPRMAEAPAPAEQRAEQRLGIEVTELTPDIARQLDFDRTEGVVIENVNPTGPAARQGVGPGALILEINRRAVSEVEDVENLLDGMEGGEIVSLRLGLPNGSSRVVNVRIPG